MLRIFSFLFCLILSTNLFAELNGNFNLHSDTKIFYDNNFDLTNDSRFICFADCLEKRKEYDPENPDLNFLCFKSCDRHAPYVSENANVYSIDGCKNLDIDDCVECVVRFRDAVPNVVAKVYECATKDL